MMPYKDGLRIPEIDTSLCIGCGGCEYICPTRPRAIIVYGNHEHEIAKMPEIQIQEKKEVDGFGF
jgi:formate hydrogenlyase subunit 6/NADH:ubiquinone oxidoreductase subunit I